MPIKDNSTNPCWKRSLVRPMATGHHRHVDVGILATAILYGAFLSIGRVTEARAPHGGWIGAACFVGAIIICAYFRLTRRLRRNAPVDDDNDDDKADQTGGDAEDGAVTVDVAEANATRSSSRDCDESRDENKKKRRKLRKVAKQLHKLSLRKRKKRKHLKHRHEVTDETGRVLDFEDDDSSSVETELKEKEWYLSSRSFPSTTLEERTRFLRARDGDVPAACGQLKNYLEWRARFEDDQQDDPRTDANDDGGSSGEDPVWTRACEQARSLSTSAPPTSVSCTIPPSIAHFLPNQESLRSNGRRLIQHIPARIDPSIVDSDVYATALALYLDRQMQRDSMEKFCVVIDVRPGAGWGNVPAPKLVPFIKHAARLLNELHPERLERCILFPVPWFFTWLWNLVKRFLDPGTASKVHLVSGRGDLVDWPVPKDLESYLTKEAIDWMEQNRLSLFA